MKNKYVREIRRIVANYSIGNSISIYQIDITSITYKIVRDLIRRNLIKCKKIEGRSLFVIPTNISKTFFKKGVTKNIISPLIAAA